MGEALSCVFVSHASFFSRVPGVPQAVLFVLSVAKRALAAYGVRPGQRDVLFQQHRQDLVVVPVGCKDDRSHIHRGGVLWVLNALHQFLKAIEDPNVRYCAEVVHNKKTPRNKTVKRGD